MPDAKPELRLCVEFAGLISTKIRVSTIVAGSDEKHQVPKYRPRKIGTATPASPIDRMGIEGGKNNFEPPDSVLRNIRKFNAALHDGVLIWQPVTPGCS